VGNLLLGDEGVGVRAVEAISREKSIPAGVEVVDGGTGGADLIDVLAERERVIVIDAFDAGLPPGTVLRRNIEEVAAQEPSGASLHEFGVVEAVAATRLLGCAPKEVVVFGIQPGSVAPGLALSPEASRAVEEVVQMVVEELRS